MSQAFRPGAATWYASDSPSSDFSAVFEDDGDTGYFYAFDRALQDSPILDAIHANNATDVRDEESVVEVAWSADGLKAALLINDYPYAVIDFPQRCSFSRTGYPPARPPWRRGTWDDGLMESF